ncbi:hypothetical protein FRC12_014787, partial [Ceratobasidium sp. 428]
GPGGSGNNFVAFAGEWLSTLVDGKYDIIGFDPRGANLTGPWTECFETESKPIWSQLQLEVLGVPYPHSNFHSDRALVTKISALQATHNAACLKYGNRKMLESTGTTSVVNDMVRIVEALGEDGLNYWGCSYGTVLGATFAAMRPDLAKRMVLDGVADAEAWFNDVWRWGMDGMKDTHKTLTAFLSTCAEAGPTYCAFAVPPDNLNVTQTTETLRNRLNAIYARLGDRPLVVADSPVGPGIFTASNLQKLILPLLYKPVTWPSLMQILTSVEQGDATSAYTAVYSPYMNVIPQPYNQNVFNRSMQHHFLSRESQYSVLCADTAPTNISVDEYTNYFREMGKLSPTGENWARVVGGCNGWSFQANQRYKGPWSVEDGLKKTRFPILFLNLDADAVTPLSTAVRMSERFGQESATLLVQQGFGHCTFTHPSLCTAMHVRDYFVHGKVPQNGTYCTPEPGFPYPTGNTTLKHVRTKREDEVLKALHNLGEIRSRFDLNA